MRTRQRNTKHFQQQRATDCESERTSERERKRALTNCQNNWTELPNALAAQDVNF